MPTIIDSQRGSAIAELLYDAFSTTGILGRKDMPEDVLPAGVQRGSLEHLMFITLTVAIDYQRNAPSLWESSKRSFEDPETRYLYDPQLLHEAAPKKVKSDMQKHGLSKKPRNDAYTWMTVGVTFYKKWGGNPSNFLEDCSWDSVTILERLRSDSHRYNKKMVSDYPFLRGPKIGPLWLRMLRDNVGIAGLKYLDKVPIPVDVHVARATLATGVVKGKMAGKFEDLYEDIRKAWFASVQGLRLKNRPMIALDVDEPLWHLSKYGCSARDKDSGSCPVSGMCEARKFCVEGLIRIEKGQVELDT